MANIVRAAGVTEPFEQENEVPGAVDCGHVASTRRRIDKIKQSPVQILSLIHI